MTPEERKRQEKARARAQLGSIFARPERAEVERWPRLVCACGVEAGSTDEVLMCPEWHDKAEG